MVTLVIFFYVKIFSILVILETSNTNHKTTLKNAVSVEGDYCFSNQDGFNGDLNKALVFADMSPNEMDVKFLLFRCKNRDNPQNFSYLNESRDWKNSNFEPNSKTRFIVHGFWGEYPGYYFYNWMEIMKNLILDKRCDNVIAIDWRTPARSIYYYQSADNTRVVGKMIGCVINRLKNDLNINLDNIELIGHSLGAHVVGFAGREVIGGKVGRITALDPAGPGFEDEDEDKLAYTDGKCVNVIHTNGDTFQSTIIPIFDGFGLLEAVGNIDFYPNGGNAQPGCTFDYFEYIAKELFTSSIGDLYDHSCNHIRAITYAIADQYYTDNQNCQLIGYTCTSYDDFNLGQCGSCGRDGRGCKPMPFNLDYWDDPNNCDSNAVHVKYYLNTGDVEKPKEYCLYHYQIILSVKDEGTPCLGDISIKLSNNKTIDVNLGLKNQLKTNDGNKRFTKLFTDSEELGNFTRAEITSKEKTSCSVNKIEFNYMTSLNESVRKTKSSVLFSKDGKSFISSQFYYKSKNNNLFERLKSYQAIMSFLTQSYTKVE